MKMTKKLRRVWINCLRMWKWISEQVIMYDLVADCATVDSLKKDWLEIHGFTKDISEDCFFCQYESEQPRGEKKHFCPNCPGRLANRQFSCTHEKYSYTKNPVGFYNKLVQIFKKLEKENE